MKNLIIIIVFLFGGSYSLWAQCRCNLQLIPDQNTPGECCYFLSMDTDPCPGVIFGDITIDAAFSSFNPCEIASITASVPATVNINATNTFATISPIGGWNNTPGTPLTVARVCFENGNMPLSLVRLEMNGFDAAGTLVASCPNFIEVDATCGANPCEALFSWEQTDCHEVQFTDLSSGVPVLSYDWDFTNDGFTDATTQNPIYDFGAPGAYPVCLTIIAGDGCSDQYCTTINVVAENDPPFINCPADIAVHVAACDRGAIVNFTMPTASDDCGQVSVVCSHNSGDFFPCGPTIITCTATDDQGNTATCNFLIDVICDCVETTTTSITCGAEPDQFDFSLTLIDLSNSITCNAIISLQGGIGNLTINNNSWVAGVLNVDGTIDATAYPFPQNFDIQVDLSCTCPDGLPYDCTHFVNFVTPCCDSASIQVDSICNVAEEHFIDIDFYGTVNDIVQIDYFVHDAPCPGIYWGGIPFQTSLGYQPLRVLPQYHTQDICVYAEITLGSNELPCTFLVTDIATLTLCSDYQCSLNSQEYCYAGSPIQPAAITYSGNLPDCDFTIEWYDFNGNLIPLPPITTSYIPTPLTFTATGQCSQDFTFEMRIIGECGPSSCTSTIRLWNEDAPVGDLYLDPLENLPLCYGEDASIRYDEECALPTDQWTWAVSTDGSTYNPISTAGNRNPYYNTNRLYQDHWFSVERQNGICPADTTSIYIPVKPPLDVTQFDAEPLDPCRDTGLKLSVQYSPCVPSINNVCNCDFTLDWYKNGLLIATTISTNPYAAFTYIAPALNGNYAGVYYAVVTDNCCGMSKRSPWAIAEPPIGLAIMGPCFICDTTAVTLTGVVLNGPVNGTCTYQWYYNGQIWAGGTNLSLVTTKPGLYKLVMTCVNGNTSCIKEAEFEVDDCRPPISTIDFSANDFDYTLVPNPGNSYCRLMLSGEKIKDFKVRVANDLGQTIRDYDVDGWQETVELDNLTPGSYIVIVISKEQGVLTKKLIIQ